MAAAGGVPGMPLASGDLEPALAVCRRCEVPGGVREYAMEAVEPLLVGVLGGTSGFGFYAPGPAPGGWKRLTSGLVVVPRFENRFHGGQREL